MGHPTATKATQSVSCCTPNHRFLKYLCYVNTCFWIPISEPLRFVLYYFCFSFTNAVDCHTDVHYTPSLLPSAVNTIIIRKSKIKESYSYTFIHIFTLTRGVITYRVLLFIIGLRNVVFSKAGQSVMALKHGISIVCLNNGNVMPTKKRTSLPCTYGNQAVL